MHIYLIRHAESDANIDETVLLQVADKDIAITEKGHTQSALAGEWLSAYLRSQSGDRARIVKVRHSPYRRATQTKDNILSKLGHAHEGGLVHHVEENDLLREQNLGYFAGYSLEERARLFPEEHAYFQKEWSEGRSYWAPRPGGESREDVAKRMDNIIPELLNDQNNGVTDLIIIGHGIAHRLLVKQLTGKSVEEFDMEPNPGNCHIRLIELRDGIAKDHGYIYEAVSHMEAVKEKRAKISSSVSM